MEARYTSVMRSTRSGNYYNVPLAPEVLGQAELSPQLAQADALVEESAAAAWGTSTVRRMATPLGKVDLNASLEIPIEMAGGRQRFRPAFAFDVNTLVSTLHRSASDSSLASSFGSSKGASSSFGPRETVIMSVEPTQPRRGRRGAMSGEPDIYASRVQNAGNENSIIAYSINKKKQRKLAAAALAASALNKSAPSLEYVGVESSAGYLPQYIVPQYRQQPAAPPSTPVAPPPPPPPPVTRNREPSIYTESFAF
jgi:hypothetical protein